MTSELSNSLYELISTPQTPPLKDLKDSVELGVETLHRDIVLLRDENLILAAEYAEYKKFAEDEVKKIEMAQVNAEIHLKSTLRNLHERLESLQESLSSKELEIRSLKSKLEAAVGEVSSIKISMESMGENDRKSEAEIVRLTSLLATAQVSAATLTEALQRKTAEATASSKEATSAAKELEVTKAELKSANILKDEAVKGMEKVKMERDTAKFAAESARAGAAKAFEEREAGKCAADVAAAQAKISEKALETSLAQEVVESQRLREEVVSVRAALTEALKTLEEAKAEACAAKSSDAHLISRANAALADLKLRFLAGFLAVLAIIYFMSKVSSRACTPPSDSKAATPEL